MALVVLVPGASVAQEIGTRQNILLILTDDQDFSTLKHMPSVQTELAVKGTTLENFFLSYPVCCPSRATMLTGLYAHNHGIWWI